MKKLTALLICLLLAVSFAGTAYAEDAMEKPDAQQAADSPALSLEEPSPSITKGLHIISDTLYDGMSKTYADGYIPSVQDGRVRIVLPLSGRTYDGYVHVTADLGTTLNSPFVYGNYSKSIANRGDYLFVFDIPLQQTYYNGIYPIEFTAKYLDENGAQALQTFVVHVWLEDGVEPKDETAPSQETVRKPDLFITSCVIEPLSIGGDEVFNVSATITNIGKRKAQAIKLTYGSEDNTILPLDSTGASHINDLDPGEERTLSLKLKSAPDILAGNHAFFIALAYSDAYGSNYSALRSLSIGVTQPTLMQHDPIVLPKEVKVGEVIDVHASVMNTGNSYLRNVSIALQGDGLAPISSLFLGDIPPKETGSGELQVLITEKSNGDEPHGQTSAEYTIHYEDDARSAFTAQGRSSTKIVAPATEASIAPQEERPAMQWWLSIALGVAILLILLISIVTTRIIRRLVVK